MSAKGMKKLILCLLFPILTYAAPPAMQFSLDVQDPTDWPRGFVIRQATTPRIDFRLVEQGSAYTNIVGATAVFHYYKDRDDGTIQVTSSDVTAEDGILHLDFTAIESNTNGAFKAELIVTLADGSLIQWGRGRIEIEKSVATGVTPASTDSTRTYANIDTFVGVEAYGPYRAGTNVTFSTNADGSVDINGGAGGGGSGDLTEVQVSGGLLTVATGTGPIPVVGLTAASVNSAETDPNAVLLTTAQTIAGSKTFNSPIIGSGANLTSLNATELDSGTIPLARIVDLTSNEVAAATDTAYRNVAETDPLAGTEYVGTALVAKGQTGDARGTTAVDLQLSRAASTQVASGTYASLTGGEDNTASGNWSTVVGGSGNTASGTQSTVISGADNVASGTLSTILGGANNEATALYAMASGRKSKAVHVGARVFSDQENADFTSTAQDQFLIRAAGNVGINTNAPSTALEVFGTATATAFSGDGANLTDLNATQLTSGTVANTRLGDIKIANSTGVLTGGVLSIGAGTNTYSISDGTGVIVDENGLLTSVSWTGKSNIVPTNLGSALLTWVSIDSGGNVSEHIIPCDANMKRSQVCLGVVVHVNLSTVDAVNNEQVIAYNPMSSLYDLASAIGFMNISGNVFSPNGANLNFDKTIGDIFATGSNYPNDANDPHVKSLPALTALTFQYRFSDGSNGTTGAPIDPDNLDDGAGGLNAVANNKWSVQRIYSFISNNVKLQRGVSDYSDKASAIAGISSEPFITEPSIEANGLLRGWLVVKKGATDLSDSGVAEFIPAGKFGGGSGGTGGGGGSPPATNTTTLTMTNLVAFPAGLSIGGVAVTNIVTNWHGFFAYKTTSTSVAGNGNYTTVIYDAERSDNYGLYDTTTGYFRPDQTGLWQVNTFGFSATAAGGTGNWLASALRRVSDNNNMGMPISLFTVGTSEPSINAGVITVYLVSGVDYYMRWYNADTASFSMQSGEERQFFSAEFLSP